jgi:hypothetical protein
MVSKALLPTTIQIELPNCWHIHNAFQVLLIKPYRLATNPTRFVPNLALAGQQNELGYDVDSDEYKTGYKVGEVMGSQC